MADVCIPGIREYFQVAGATHYHAGYDRDSHGLNPGSAGIADFHTGYDAAARTHSDIVPSERVDVAQGARNA